MNPPPIPDSLIPELNQRIVDMVPPGDLDAVAFVVNALRDGLTVIVNRNNGLKLRFLREWPEHL
jgi:hypothetical protein